MTNPSPRSKQSCRDAEPTLADLLNDSVLQSLLAGDHIDRAELDAVIRHAQRRLGGVRPWSTPIAGCCA